MGFKQLGLLMSLKFAVMKDTMKYYSSNIKTENNKIIRGKWKK